MNLRKYLIPIALLISAALAALRADPNIIPAFPVYTSVTQALSNKTVDSSNLLSPDAVVLPHRFVVGSADSLSNAGDQFWDAAFTGNSTGNAVDGTGTSNYEFIHSFHESTNPSNPSDASNTGGTGVHVKPGTTWPEYFSGLAGASTEFFDYCYSGQLLNDSAHNYPQEGHRVSPAITGIPAAYVIWAGTNDLQSGTSASDIWNNILSLISQARRDDYYPIVVFTLPPNTAQNHGSTYDTNRLTLNASIVASTVATGGSDLVLDLNAVPEIAATNSPTGSAAYTHNGGYYEDAIHPNAAGNQKIASALFTALRSASFNIASRTQHTQRPFLKWASHFNAPWANQRLQVRDFDNGTVSGGTFDTGPVNRKVIGVGCGTASGQYAQSRQRSEITNSRIGLDPLGGGGQGSINWRQAFSVEFCFYGAINAAEPNSAWYAGFGHSTHGDITSSEHYMGIKITSTVSGTLNVYSVAANGSTLTTTLLTTVPDNSVVNIVQLYCDGNGGFTVVLNEKAYTALNCLFTGYTNDYMVIFEAATSGTSDQKLVYFSDAEIDFP